MEFELLSERKGYKANLHCHTTDSDGHVSPEEMKRQYKERGFSVLAYTDHAYMRDRTSLSDENFVAISGYENHLEPPRVNGKAVKCYHMNFYSPRPDKVGMVGICGYTWKWYNEIYREQKGWKPRLVGETPESPLIGGICSGEYSIENANKFIKEANDEGYIVVLNHPAWGKNDWRDLAGLKGLNGLEIFNYDCWRGGYEADSGSVYDLMLRDGQRLNCFANDDYHAGGSNGFGGFNFIHADKLEYSSVFEAIKNGKSYASSGAELRGVYLKDGKVHIGCEPAAYIRLVTDYRADIVWAGATPLTGATFDLKNDDWFRIVVKTEKGLKAYTKAYFTDEYRK